MSINRVIVALPVLLGLMLTGTAVAHMLPRDTVRDSVYQTCAHNGVHFNKQGHANCGLHKGWSDEGSTGSTEESTGGTTGSEPADTGDDQGQTGSTEAGTRHGGKGHGHEHPAKPEHSRGHHASHGHSSDTQHGRHGHSGDAQHGHSGHAGHASSHGGHGRGHSAH